MPTPHINATTITTANTSRISRLDIKAPLVHANADTGAYDHPAVAAYAGGTPDERSSAHASPPLPGRRPLHVPHADGGGDGGTVRPRMAAVPGCPGGVRTGRTRGRRPVADAAGGRRGDAAGPRFRRRTLRSHGADGGRE